MSLGRRASIIQWNDAAQSELAHHLLIEPIDKARTGEGYQTHFPLLTRLESDSRAGGNVEPVAARGLPVKGQPGIGFGEMIVRADLNRTVANTGTSWII